VAGRDTGGSVSATSYWDIDSTGQSTSPGGGTPKHTIDLKTALQPGFDAAVWAIYSDPWIYPYLKWQAFQFLASPLDCGNPKCSITYDRSAYTYGIMNTVLDHSLIQNTNGYWQYGRKSRGGGDGIIIAFNNEKANGALKPSDERCVGGTILLKPTPSSPLQTAMTNTRGCGAGYASYDEHPGYDYHAALGTPVKAAAAGTVVNNDGQRCVRTNISQTCDDWGYVGIDHGNGYITQYGHLQVGTISVTAGQAVIQGQQIGLSGHTAPVTLLNHLHFEVIKLIPGHPNDYSGLNYAVVDPYGWVGPGTDPLYSVGLGIPSSVKLWQ
jgi:hypothetical protein